MKALQNLSPKTRKAVYALTGAVLFVLVVFGIVTPDNVPQILNIVGGVLGVGAVAIALPNVPKE